MKTNFLFLSIVLFCSSASTLLCYEQKESNFSEGTITVQDYCTFLNETMEGEVTENQALDCEMIVRSGEPGSYRYEAAPGEADAAMSFLSVDDAVAYCEWKNQSLPFPVFSLLSNSQVGNSDHSLKSSLFAFCLMKIEGTVYEAGGAGIDGIMGAEEIEEVMGLATIAGLGITEPAGRVDPSDRKGLVLESSPQDRISSEKPIDLQTQLGKRDYPEATKTHRKQAKYLEREEEPLTNKQRAIEEALIEGFWWYEQATAAELKGDVEVAKLYHQRGEVYRKQLETLEKRR